MKKVILSSLIVVIAFVSCKKGNDSVDVMSNGPSPDVRFVFKQSYNGSEVTAADFGTTVYTNAKGTSHTISKLQYLVSNITLHKTDGSEVDLGGYNLVDLALPLSRFYTASKQIPEGTYTGVSLTFGFNEADNISGKYKDLNAASWSWPSMLGPGYHFMKFEGMFTDNGGAQKGFAYHNGTASKVINGGREFEANHFRVRLWDLNGGFEISNEGTTHIDIDMNIAEWFRNPILWDLNQYHMMLMPNYTAQKMINQNGRSVFSLGNVSHE